MCYFTNVQFVCMWIWMMMRAEASAHALTHTHKVRAQIKWFDVNLRCHWYFWDAHIICWKLKLQCKTMYDFDCIRAKWHLTQSLSKCMECSIFVAPSKPVQLKINSLSCNSDEHGIIVTKRVTVATKEIAMIFPSFFAISLSLIWENFLHFHKGLIYSLFNVQPLRIHSIDNNCKQCAVM